MQQALLETNLKGLGEPCRGKVRDVYPVGEDKLLIVSTDRISAFDVIMPTGIPDKGIILTQITLFWLKLLGKICPNHLVTANVDNMPEEVRKHKALIEGRCMLVETLSILLVEAIVRGYLTGSGKKEYDKSGTVCKIPLPSGLVEASKLECPLYTPSTKAPAGQHDLNISPEQAEEILGVHASTVSSYALELYETAAQYASTQGIIIADTKFEFGVDPHGNVVLADEVLTPDSSRFWPAVGYQPGNAQPSFDKQFVRDYLESIGFDKNGPGVVLPEDVVMQTQAKYLEAYRMLTGQTLTL